MAKKTKTFEFLVFWETEDSSEVATSKKVYKCLEVS